MVVHVLGVPAHSKYLREISDKYGVYLLEDCCAALGSKHNDGKMVGTDGHMSTYSFYFGHQLSTIEGGMINTDDKLLYEHLLMGRSHGWGKDLPKETYDTMMKENNICEFHQPFTFFIPGFNLRSTDFQAYIGLGQMEKADWVSKRRHENHCRYKLNFSGTEITSQLYDKNQTVCSISFGSLCFTEENRKKIVDSLVKNGIETRLFSAGNLGKHPFWAKFYGKEQNFRVANKIHSCGFFLPNYPELGESDVDFISFVVLGAINEN
jgi:CDP-6-deoxy-D-xylo-4-hexulose-3-dehydrase